jgi:3-methyladenine DNA glycosylase AlkD
VPESTVDAVLAELAALEDPKVRAVNEKHGDDHGVNLGKLRAVAKRLKTQQDLARELWATGDTTAKLLVASAGWALTTDRVANHPEDLDGLLDLIEKEMKDAPDRLQWAMNSCLARIGIEHESHRARAIDIGERLEVLKDYPTPPNCTSPFAPVWIAEMVRRQA